MTFTATPCRASDLRPGKAFSLLGPEFWGDFPSNDPLAVGTKVYVRTEAPVMECEKDELVYRVTWTA